MTTPPITPQSHRPLPYEETTDPLYTREVAQNHDLQHVRGDDYAVICTCPRCGAALDIELFEPGFRAMVRAVAPAGAQPAPAPAPAPVSTSTVVPMSCVCLGTHDGRPEGRSGCGAFWTLTLS
ncbi:hypothetical protein ACWGE1_29090 [Streptomyces sp. NPDC054932]